VNYRVYFNAKEAFPYVWSIDQGTPATEIKVKEVHFHDIQGVTRYDHKVRRGSITQPRAWIECINAELIVRDGDAYLMKGFDK